MPILALGSAGNIQATVTQPDNNTTESGQGQEQARDECIEYDSVQKLITIQCESIRLTDIYNSLDNPAVLDFKVEDNSIDDKKAAKVWILDAGILIEKDSSLIIDSSDTSWLKMIPTPTIQLTQSSNVTEETDYSDDTLTVIQNDSGKNTNSTNDISNIENGTVIVSKHNGDNPNGIHVHGSLKIDSVKITSWDPEKNDVIKFDFGKRPREEHTKSKYDTVEPRAFIRVSKDATGTTNITNSEIAYLGYSCSRCAGLSYYGGEGSVIENSDIHHLLKGFYSKNAAHITINNNTIHDNYLYGIDPHTGSHDFTITNNLVYNNNASGIICSKNCYNLLIEGNEVFDNAGAARGIVFSINTTNSIARNNYVHDQPRCISFNRASDNNTVYNNTVSDCKIGVFLSNTGYNSIYDNTISNSRDGIQVQNITNKIYNNTISESKNGIVLLPHYANETNGIPIPNVVNNTENLREYLTDTVAANQISDTENPMVFKNNKTNTTKL